MFFFVLCRTSTFLEKIAKSMITSSFTTHWIRSYQRAFVSAPWLFLAGRKMFSLVIGRCVERGGLISIYHMSSMIRDKGFPEKPKKSLILLACLLWQIVNFCCQLSRHLITLARLIIVTRTLTTPNNSKKRCEQNKFRAIRDECRN